MAEINTSLQAFRDYNSDIENLYDGIIVENGQLKYVPYLFDRANNPNWHMDVLDYLPPEVDARARGQFFAKADYQKQMASYQQEAITDVYMNTIGNQAEPSNDSSYLSAADAAKTEIQSEEPAPNCVIYCQPVVTKANTYSVQLTLAQGLATRFNPGVSPFVEVIDEGIRITIDTKGDFMTTDICKDLKDEWQKDEPGISGNLKQNKYVYLIPKANIQRVLERNFNLRDLPTEGYRDGAPVQVDLEECSTFYELFIKQNSKMQVKAENLSLTAPPPTAVEPPIIASEQSPFNPLDHCIYHAQGKTLEGKKSLQNILFHLAAPESHLSPAQLQQAKLMAGNSQFHPQITLVPGGLSVKLPEAFCKAKMDTALIKQLESLGIEVKPFDINFTMGSKYTKEFVIQKKLVADPSKPNKIVSPLPHFIKQLKLSEQIPQNQTAEAKTTLLRELTKEDLSLFSYQVHHLRASDNEVRAAGTLSVSLGALDPATRNAIQTYENQHPEKKRSQLFTDREISVPWVEFDPVRGMIIKVPKGLNISTQLQQLFLLKEEDINWTSKKSGRTYTKQFCVPRDEIEGFLLRLGMNEVVGSSGTLYTYYKDLQILNDRAYDYRPVINDQDPFDSVEQSLKKVMPGGDKSKFKVMLQKNGSLEIQAQGDKTFLNNVSHFVGYELKLADGPDGSHGTFTVPADQLEYFLKHKLKLVRTDEKGKLVVQQQLEAWHPFKNFEVSIQATNSNEVHILKTIARSLGTFDPDIKQALSNVSEKNEPPSTVNLPVVKATKDGIHILIPKSLHQKKLSITPNDSYRFGEYLSQVLKLQGASYDKIEDGIQMGARLFIPKEEVKAFLEKKLGMYEMPEVYQKRKTGRVLFANELTLPFGQAWGIPHKSYGPINKAAISMANPPIPIPIDAPAYPPAEVENKVNEVLKGHPKAEVLRTAIMHTYNFEDEEFDLEANRDSITVYLRGVIKELDNPEIPNDRKRQCLINIGEGCTSDICYGGRAGKITNEYERLINPIAADPLQAAILKEISEFKTDLLLTDTFKLEKKDPDSEEITQEGIPEANHTHVVSYALMTWKNLGLNEAVGLADETNAIQYGKGWHKKDSQQKFIKAYLKSAPQLVGRLYDKLNVLDDQGYLPHAIQYYDKIKEILTKRGLSPEQVEAEMTKLLPPTHANVGEAGSEEVGAFKLTPHALELILIDMGILLE